MLGSLVVRRAELILANEQVTAGWTSDTINDADINKVSSTINLMVDESSAGAQRLIEYIELHPEELNTYMIDRDNAIQLMRVIFEELDSSRAYNLLEKVLEIDTGPKEQYVSYLWLFRKSCIQAHSDFVDLLLERIPFSVTVLADVLEIDSRKLRFNGWADYVYISVIAKINDLSAMRPTPSRNPLWLRSNFVSYYCAYRILTTSNWEGRREMTGNLLAFDDVRWPMFVVDLEQHSSAFFSYLGKTTKEPFASNKEDEYLQFALQAGRLSVAWTDQRKKVTKKLRKMVDYPGEPAENKIKMKQIIATAEKEWPRIWKESQETTRVSKLAIEAWNKGVNAVVPDITGKDVVRGINAMASVSGDLSAGMVREWIIAIAGRFQYLLSEQDTKDILRNLSPSQ